MEKNTPEQQAAAKPVVDNGTGIVRVLLIESGTIKSLTDMLNQELGSTPAQSYIAKEINFFHTTNNGIDWFSAIISIQ